MDKTFGDIDTVEKG